MAQAVAAIAQAAGNVYNAAVNFIATPLVSTLGEGGAVLAARTIVDAGISFAISTGINAITRGGIPDPEFASSNRKQTIPDRLSGYGRARIGGAFMLWEAEGSFAYNVLALHDGKVDGFETFYLNDDIVTVSGGYVQAGTDGRYGRLSDLVQLDTRVGEATETRYSQITNTTIWPTDARGDGIASLMMIAKSSSKEAYLRDYPNGLPLPSVVTRMQICYDARLGERDDPDAWAWTRNPVWQLLDYMTNAKTGMGLDYTQYFEPNIASWITAADVCDEAVPLAAGGTIPRYTGDGTYLHSSPPADVISTILGCMDGWLAQDTGGVFVIEAGEYNAPSVTITDAHIVGMDRQFFLEDERAVNELIISYTSAAYDYAEVEALPWRDETDILDRSGQVRSQRMSLPWVSTNSQARRLAKIAMARSVSPIRGTITTDLYGLKAYGQRRIRIQAPNDSAVMANIVVDVVSVTLNSDFTVTIPFIGTAVDSYDWDAATEEDSQPTITRPPPSDIPTPVLLAASYDSATARIEVIVEGPVDPSLSYQLSWNALDGDPPQQIEFPVAVASGDDWIIYTTPTIPTNEIIEIKVAFVTSSGAVGDYSNTLDVATSTLSGSANITEASDTLTGSGGVSRNITGSATITEASDTLTGAGSIAQSITGSATITEASDTVTGDGSTAPAVSYISTGSPQAGTSNPTIFYPSSPQAGDLLLITVVSRASGTDVPTPTGFTAVAATTGGAGSEGVADSGTVRIETFWKESDGTESGFVTVTAGTASYIGRMRLYRKTSGTWSVASTTGTDASAGTAWSATGSSWTVADGDMIVCSSGINGNGNASAPTSPTLTMSGLTGSPVSMGNADYGTTSNDFDSSLHTVDALVAGAATAAPTFAATYASSSASSPTGPTVFIRLRAS